MRIILYSALTALLLTSCSGAGPSGSEVVGQANAGGKVSFDIVKIDDAVVKVLQAQSAPAFPERFKKYTPPPDIKIAVGDTVSAIIWEAAANGLFGNSLAEWSLPSGVTSELSGRAPSGTGAAMGTGLMSTGESATAFASDAATRLLALMQPGATPSSEAPGSAQGLAAAGAAQGLAGRADAQGFTPPGGVQGFTSPDAARGFASLTGPEPGGTAALGLGSAAALGLSGLAASQPTGLGTAPTGTASSTLPAGSMTTPGTASRNVEELAQNITASGRPGTRIPDQQVGTDGAISIPYAGRIAAAGRTPAEVEHTIEQRLGPKAIEPHAIVVIRRSIANSVAVEGEIVRGGRVPLPLGGARLLEVIGAAGGAGAPVHETFVLLSRGGVTVTVPLATLVEHPDQDIFAEPGDILTVIRRPQTFSAFGATGKNTAITFNSAKLSLAEALAKAGGLLDDRADPRAVFLFRYEPVGVVRALEQPIATGAPEGFSPVVYRLDLSDAKSFPLAREFPVRDKDIIFVATAELADAYKVFATLQKLTGPVITGLLTCQGGSC